MSTDGFDNVAYNAIAHLAGMRACGTIAEHVKDTTALGAAADASFAAVQKGLQDTLWTGTHWRAAAGVCRSTPSRPCSYQSWPWGDAVMSGSLHGQSWASALGLGPLMPVVQLASHVRTEKEMACTYDPVHCFVGQQMMQQNPMAQQAGAMQRMMQGASPGNQLGQAMGSAGRFMQHLAQRNPPGQAMRGMQDQMLNQQAIAANGEPAVTDFFNQLMASPDYQGGPPQQQMAYR